jgi:hypothetical protein
MSSWFQHLPAATFDQATWWTFLIRTSIALALGGLVAAIYLWARRGQTHAPTFVRTLILLAALIAVATQVIGDNIARAFSLVGALSVVRFRTVVRDTQDTAFVIFAVVMGMAAGADNIALALVAALLLAAAAPLLWPRPNLGGAWSSCDATLTVRFDPQTAAPAALAESLARHAERVDQTGCRLSAKAGALEQTYRVRLRPDATPDALALDLRRLDGVLGLELNRESS